MRMRTDLRSTTLHVAGVAALGVLLAACGGNDVAPKPTLPSSTGALWNPCDVLDTAFVKQEFGVAATKHAGTPTAPECRFTPNDQKSGQAAITANYLLFPGTLEDAWKTMGQPAEADVRKPRIAGADDARIVVDATKKQLYVTGFVQNGDLIQKVDIVDPAPYDEKRAVSGATAVLTRLSAHAAKSNAGRGPSAPAIPSGSPQG
jgi:hypothetical protein